MSSKRVWAVKGQYPDGLTRPKRSVGTSIEYDTLSKALEDVEYLWDAGFGSSMRSYVVSA